MNTLEFVATAVVVAMTIAFFATWDSESKFGENLRNEARALLLFPVITYQYLGGLLVPRIAKMMATRSTRALQYHARYLHSPRHLLA